MPHFREFVQVRQVMAAGDSLGAMLHNALFGIIHLDRRGRILDTNDRALDILRRVDGLSASADGVLRFWLPADESSLQRLLAGALPP